MICSSCGAENRAGRKFCAQCGASLLAGCLFCGAVNEPGERFCGECGAALDAGAVAVRPAMALAPSADSPTAERRLVSVLFGDLVGFTALSETRDSEEVRDLLTRYFDTARKTIGRYGGTVEKFIGDAVMAVWGTPTAQEDDAERAVRAALDLTEAVAALGSEVGAPELRVRAGVMTGEAAVALDAEGQGMVAGDLVNTASRVQSLAVAGTVLVGEATRRATEAAIVYEEAGSHQVKGKTEPISVWRAVRVVAARRGALKSTGLEPSFVGRDREFRLVKDLYHASADQGRAHLVSIVGAAGLGKSRLSWEFFKYLDGLAANTFWHRGACLSYGEGVTYWALAEMVRMRAGMEEGEEPAAALAKLQQMLEQYVPEPEERRMVESRLAHLLGLEVSTVRDREDLFSAWRLFFERLAEKDPTVLVFEDMQWADTALLDFIGYLMDWSKNHSLFVVTLARPELFDRHPDWGSGRRNLTSIFLEPLTELDTDQLLSGLVPGLPDGTRATIRDRAEGVPLYAVETVRMLIDRGLLSREGSTYQLTRPLEALEVPETLHALIAARLDGLTAGERRLIQDASVLGKTFFKHSVTALAGVPQDDIDGLLASLVRKEVLALQNDPRSPDRGQYAFLQDLVRRVAYETLSKRDRKARHLQVAGLLEEAVAGGEEDIVQVLASHYLEAYRAAPEAPDAVGIKGKAASALSRAGARAASLAASEDAQLYFAQAADLIDLPVAKAALLERAGQMAFRANRVPEAGAYFELAVSLFESEGRTHPAARVTARLADADWRIGRMELAVDRMERAFAVLSGDPPDEDLATLAAQLGRFHFFSGNVELGATRIETALAMAESLGLPAVLSEAFQTRALISLSRQRNEEAVAFIKHALELALSNDISSTALRAFSNLGEVLNSRDRYEEALDNYRRGMALAQKVGDRSFQSSLLSEAAFTLVRLGRWDEALELAAQVPDLGRGNTETMSLWQGLVEVHVHRGKLAEAPGLLSLHAQAESSADLQDRSIWAAVTAMVALSQGDAERSRSLAEEGLRAAEQLGGSQATRSGVVIAMESAFAQGDLERVEELLGTIQGLPRGVIPPVLLAQRERFGARLAAARGQTDGVEEGFRAAAAVFGDVGVVFSQAVTRLELAEWFIEQDRAGDAEPLLEQAGAVFERLEARPWLERLSRSARPEAALAGASSRWQSLSSFGDAQPAKRR